MKIQLDLDAIPASWRQEQYQVLADYWEDSEEWADLLILDPILQTWIRLSMPEVIILD
jgi:hypothetical protein